MQVVTPHAPANLTQIGTFNPAAPAPLAIDAGTRVGNSYTQIEDAIAAGRELSRGDATTLAVIMNGAGVYDLTHVYSRTPEQPFRPFDLESMRILPSEFSIDAHSGVKALVDGSKVFGFGTPDIFV